MDHFLVGLGVGLVSVGRGLVSRVELVPFEQPDAENADGVGHRGQGRGQVVEQAVIGGAGVGHQVGGHGTTREGEEAGTRSGGAGAGHALISCVG